MEISKIQIPGSPLLTIKDEQTRESLSSQECAINAAILDLDSKITIVDDSVTELIQGVNNSVSSVKGSINTILNTINTLRNEHSNFVTNTEFGNALQAIMQAILDLDSKITILNDTVSN